MLRFSIPALVLSNLVPVLGVLFFDWSVAAILLLYWAENVIIGLFNVFKMAISQGPKKTAPSLRAKGSPSPPFEKVFAILFFCVHFGMFTLVHGIFVVSLFGRDLPDPATYLLAVLSLFISHALSFFFHFVKKGEYKEAHFNRLFFQPYKRVIVMHVTIIAAGWAMGFLGSPDWAVLILILLKILFDIGAHRKEHAAPIARSRHNEVARRTHAR
jgi:hypothetical protein